MKNVFIFGVEGKTFSCYKMTLDFSQLFFGTSSLFFF